jgi:Tol biopolymer transport system component
VGKAGLASHRCNGNFGEGCVSDRNNNNYVELMVMNADGTGQRQITALEGLGMVPSWSPDSQKLVFGRQLSTTQEIYIVDINGGEPSLVATGSHPEWSRLNKIAFEASPNIATINPDGTGLRTLAPGACPVWSPPGNKLAFLLGQGQIYVVDANGTNPQNIFNAPGYYPCSSLTWSPDGQQLAFSKDGGLYIINADGTELQNIIPEPGNSGAGAFFPVWSPDGTQIAFQSPLAVSDIFVINTDGTDLQNLTNSTGIGDYAPFWELQ